MDNIDYVNVYIVYIIHAKSKTLAHAQIQGSETSHSFRPLYPTGQGYN